jgi:Flp pilus assembly protein TadG
MRTDSEKGFALLATAVCIVSLLGMLGLALDLGRVFIAKNETQTFTDTAALAAAMKLDGKSFTAANTAVTNNTKNQWNMATTTFTASGGATTVTTEFAQPQAANASLPDNSTWSAAPASAAGHTFVRVTATATLPLYILPVVGTASGQTVKASSVAGQVPLTSFHSGLLPYSPIWHATKVATNPPFGFVVGQWYTLRQSNGATITNSDLCPGDQGDAAYLTVVNAQPTGLLGFYQSPAASVAAHEIISGAMVYPVNYPGTITMYSGDKQSTANDLNQRIDDDTDNISTSYEQYQANTVNGNIVGNGYRLVGVPVNDGTVGATRTVEGFAGFFLSASSTTAYYSSGGSKAFCAEYYGTWSKGQQTQGAGKPGIAYISVLTL